MTKSSMIISRLLLFHRRVLAASPRYISTLFHSTHPYSFTSQTSRNYSSHFTKLSLHARVAAADRALQDFTYQAEREREERLKAGPDTADLDVENEEDYIGVGLLIEKLDKEKARGDPPYLNRYEEPTDSESDDDDSMKSKAAVNKRIDQYEKKFMRHEDQLHKFTKAETLDDAYKLMKRIDKFEDMHSRLKPEYRVIGELMNRLKVAEGNERYLLQEKLSRAWRMVKWKEIDPNDPANYGVIQHEQVGAEQVGPSVDILEHGELEKERRTIQDELEFDDLKERDTVLLEKLKELDKQLEQKLVELDHTFGKKGKSLEEEIRDLAEERNSLTEQKRKLLYRKGFDVKVIDVYRTCKVTKGGQVQKYTVMLACGDYHGVVGFAKAKGPTIPIALQKANEKCFQNLHYIERHEEHTIAHAIQTSYKKTKVYLWPAPIQTGMKADKTVQTVLSLAGFKNVKSKIVGSRDPHNTVKAIFKALNAIETPIDVQQKFG